MAACCLSNFAGGGGGAVFATTSRVTTGAGGLAAAGRPAPSTDCLVGGIAGVAATTGALAISLSLTLITLLCTDCPLVKVCVEVAVSAPGPRWFSCVGGGRFTCFFFLTVCLLVVSTGFVAVGVVVC